MDSNQAPRLEITDGYPRGGTEITQTTNSYVVMHPLEDRGAISEEYQGKLFNVYLR